MTILAPVRRLFRIALRRGRPGRTFGLLVAVASTGGLFPTLSAEPEELMRFGFSARMFEGVNLNDAQASMKVWARQIATEQGVPVSPVVLSYDNYRDIEIAINQREVEAIAVCADEFFLLRSRVPVGTFVLSDASGEKTEQYLLLVRRDRGFQNLGELKGRSLVYVITPRAAIIRHWLQVEQLEAGWGDLASHWGRIEGNNKLSKVILPVFFGQADACLVTRSGFEVMAELNPQVGQQLVPIATSGPVIASVFFFRGSYTSRNVDRVIDIFTHASEDAAAQQILTLFQQDRLSVGTQEDLAPTLHLLERYFTLTRQSGSAPIYPDTFPAE